MTFYSIPVAYCILKCDDDSTHLFKIPHVPISFAIPRQQDFVTEKKSQMRKTLNQLRRLDGSEDACLVYE